MASFGGVRTCSIASAAFCSQLAKHRSLAGYVFRLRTSFGEMTGRSAKMALGKALADHSVLISALEAVGVAGGLIKDLLCLLLRREVCHYSPTLRTRRYARKLSAYPSDTSRSDQPDRSCENTRRALCILPRALGATPGFSRPRAIHLQKTPASLPRSAGVLLLQGRVSSISGRSTSDGAV